MAQTPQVLDDRPLTAEETLAVIDLVTTQKTLGVGHELRRLSEGRLTLGARAVQRFILSPKCNRFRRNAP
jgi:hypothetical protein